MKWKKLRKKLAVMVLAALCLTGAGRMRVFANANEEAVQEETKKKKKKEPEEESRTVIEENGEPDGNAFSVPGNGEVLDHVTDGSTKEFYTIRTANNNTFYLVVDKSQNTQNVYMLADIDENDLQDFLDEPREPKPEALPGVVLPEVEEPVEPEEPQEEAEAASTEPLPLIIGMGALAGVGIFCLARRRSKQADEADESENLEIGDGLETVNEDEE